MELLAMLFNLSGSAILAAMGAAVGLLLIYFLILYRREQSLADYGVKISLENKSNRWIEKKSQELERVEAFRLAGDLKAHLKKWNEAAELYMKGGNFIKAAKSHLSAGDAASAARAYLQSMDYEKAASLFLENRDYQNAAVSYLKAGYPLMAAQTFEKGGAFDQSAEIYLEHGMYRRAAETYARKQMWSRSAEAIWRCFGREKARLPEEVSPLDSMPLRRLARLAGDLFRKAGKQDEAVEAYQEGGWLELRAEALVELDRLQEAAETYLEAGRNMLAADTYEKAGDKRLAAALRAQFHLDHGRNREAVPFLTEAGEHIKAAQILASEDQFEGAAESYERAEKYSEAAHMYEKADMLERAGACLEKAGDYRAAADYYGRAGNPGAQAEALEKDGDFIAAGANYFERGLLDRAIAVLQKIEPDNELYITASLMLGQTFREKGMLELAYEYFKRSIRDREMSRGNLENYYQLAACEERMGKPEEAAVVYEKILVLDFHYKDVADRLNTIKAARTQLETPSTPSVHSIASAPSARSKEEEEVIVTSSPGQPIEPVSMGRDERYTLVEEVGRGGMGIVYKARDNILERMVAFKILPTSLKEHPQALKNFFREAKSAARLNHPNIVTVYDAGEEGGTYYIAMEYVEGETIKQILNREGLLPVKAVIMIAGQICKALEYAHGRKIVHRDIKSSNIMWTPEKQIKLMDFGLAKVIEEVKGYQTIASGTPYYMSPEQTLGRNIDHRTDIYSLGITMFEMATGKLPFRHGDAAYHHVHTPPPEAKEQNDGLPDNLNDIILRCMQKKPEDRYHNAKELFKALKKVV